MNFHAIKAIYTYEMSRWWRTIYQSIISPVLTTSLYFIVFGAAIGSRISEVGGVSYGAFIVPGLIMLSLMTQSVSYSSFAIYFPKFTGTIYELLSSPISFFEILLGYVGASATKAALIGAIILVTAKLFVDFELAHPVWMWVYLIITSITFSMLGFIIGLWAENFEELQVIPLLIITPLVFLGGTFYSISMLSGIWHSIALFNPVWYLVNGFRWTFYGQSDIDILTSSLVLMGFFLSFVVIIAWIFKTGYKLKN